MNLRNLIPLSIATMLAVPAFADERTTEEKVASCETMYSCINVGDEFIPGELEDEGYDTKLIKKISGLEGDFKDWTDLYDAFPTGKVKDSILKKMKAKAIKDEDIHELFSVFVETRDHGEKLKLLKVMDKYSETPEDVKTILLYANVFGGDEKWINDLEVRVEEFNRPVIEVVPEMYQFDSEIPDSVLHDIYSKYLNFFRSDGSYAHLTTGIENVKGLDSLVMKTSEITKIPIELLRGLILQESNGNVHAINPTSGATGAAQILVADYRAVKLAEEAVGGPIDYENNPFHNMLVGAFQLGVYLGIKGPNPFDATTAYNAGPHKKIVGEAIENFGAEDYELYRFYLSEEAENYAPSVFANALAYHIADKYPEIDKQSGTIQIMDYSEHPSEVQQISDELFSDIIEELGDKQDIWKKYARAR